VTTVITSHTAANQGVDEKNWTETSMPIILTFWLSCSLHGHFTCHHVCLVIDKVNQGFVGGSSLASGED